jgi:beta-lactamase class A
MNNTAVEKLQKRLKTQKIIMVVLAVCIPIAGYFGSQYLGVNPIENNKYPMLDPLRKFIPQENYLTNIEELRTYLRFLGDKYPDSISIYYENINSGANISINKDLHLFPASLSKLVQAILITKKVEDGKLTWDTMLKAKDGDISSESGTLYKTIGSNSMTVEKLLDELLVNSDNTAQNIFKHQLEVDDYLAFQEKVGLQDLYNEKGFISAKEYTRLLRVLYTSNFLDPQNSEKILDYMSRAVFKDYLSQGIPFDVKFAHKYGENDQYNIFADSGIVYVPGKPYMITVIIKGKDSTIETRDWAIGLMKEISEKAYNISK